MKKIKWHDVRLVLILGAVVFLYSFSSKRNESRKLTTAEIEFSENENFITIDEVNKLLIQNFGQVSTIRKDGLDLNNVEKRINKNPMVEKAEIYTTVDGKLKAKIRQKKPVARVFEGDSSYYVDYNGARMPLSENYTARVPIVTGDVGAVDQKRFARLLRYINDDPFLKKNITGMVIRPTGGITMTNRNYDYEIMFGRIVNVEKKFNNYKAFFQNAVKDTLIEQYKTINLKFTQQVVCTKK